METIFQRIIGYNITCVYKSLELAKVDSRPLKTLLGEAAPPPALMDTPELLMVVYPPKPIVIQIGNSRVTVSVVTAVDTIDAVPIWEYIHRCNEIVADASAELIAYGFNYDVAYRTEVEDVDGRLITHFLSDPQRIEQSVGGDLVRTAPRFGYVRDKVVHDMLLDPTKGPDALQVHLNIHYEHEALALPGVDELREQFTAGYEHLVGTVPVLLREA